MNKYTFKYSDIVLNSMNLSVIVTDLEGIIIFWNDYSEQLFGWTSRETIGHSYIEYSQPYEINNEIESTKDLLSREENYPLKFISKKKDGNIIFTRVECIPLKDNDNTKSYLILPAKIPQIEEESIELFRTLSEAAFECILLSENGFGIVHNFLGEKTFGYSNAEIKGKAAIDLIVPEDRELVKKNLISNYEKPYEATALRKDGTTFPCIISGKMMTFNGKEVRVTSLRDITDIRNYQKENLLKESNLTAIIENLPGMIWLKDLKGTLLSVNKEYARICNMDSADKVIGKNDFDLWNKVLADKFTNDDSKVISSGKPLMSEDYVFVNGKYRWYETYRNAVLDENGNITGTTGYARDITDRREAQEALRKSKARYKAISHSASDAIITSDNKGIIVDWNKSAEKIFGYREKEIVGKPLTLLMDEKYHTHHNKGFFANNNLKELSKTIELSGRRMNGERFPMELSLSKWETKEGAFYSGIIRDITERYTAQIELANSKNFLDRIINTLSDPVFVKDSNHKYVLLNDQFCEFMGYKREELIDKSDVDFFPKEQVEVFIRKDNEVFESEEGNVNEELFTNSRGELHTIVTKKSIYINDSGEKFIVGIIRDITENKKMEDALIVAKENAEASDKLKTAFLNNISHEIRTPLNGILGFGELVIQHGITHENKQKHFSNLQKSAKRLLNTVNNFMDISLLVSSSMQAVFEEVNLSELINKVSAEFYDLAKYKGLNFLKSIPEKLENVLLTTDSELIEKALYQLLSNAFKFTPTGEVVIGLSNKSGYINFYVRDTGIGIKKETQLYIFDYFRQVSEGIGRFYEGNGLGLSIAKGITELLGGRISVESNKGLGSTFTISLPFIQTSKEINDSNAIDANDVNLKIPNLLIVEDDESNMYLLEMLFENKDRVKIYKANDGQEAIDMCMRNPEINVILMDLKMPEIDGYKATSIIKEHNPDIKIIALTAYSMSGDERKAIKAGCDDYIAKPVNIESLYRKIRRYGFDV